MRKMLSALVAGLAVAGGAAAIAGAAQAQPYGYYPAPGYYGYRYEPPRTYDAEGRYTPYTYENGYGSEPALAGVLLGSVLAPDVAGHAPYDQYGPDLNGMVATDGHAIKCKLVDTWSDRYGRYMKRRECW